MIRRACRDLLRFKLRIFPAVLIVGPRQCGKTTFIRGELKSWRHLDLERSTDLQALSFDMQGFLEKNPSRVAVDEAQRLPELFPALRHAIDSDRRPGRYVLTGSCEPRLLKNAGESLTGRVGIIEMTPFLMSELRPKPRRHRWFWGGYPPLYRLGGSPQRVNWLDDYLATVLERDIPALGFRIPPVRLHRLCQMLAHVHGGLLNLSDIGKSLSLSHHTVAHYLDILEGAFIIRRLQPYFANIGKRLTKSPKLYIRDSGLLHRLAGLSNPEQLEVWPKRGLSWEGVVIEEIAARLAWELPGAKIFFWRTQAGSEVDLILENGVDKIAIEIKLGSAPSAQSLQGLKTCMADLKIPRGLVICGEDDAVEIGGGVTLLPWRDVLRSNFISSLGLGK